MNSLPINESTKRGSGNFKKFIKHCRSSLSIDHLFSATLDLYTHKTFHEHLIDARFYTFSEDKKIHLAVC